MSKFSVRLGRYISEEERLGVSGWKVYISSEPMPYLLTPETREDIRDLFHRRVCQIMGLEPGIRNRVLIADLLEILMVLGLEVKI